jgi:hypothetical protein
MGKVPCTDHVHSKSCVIEMRFGHGTIARVASPQRWSESICKGKPGLSGLAGECAAAVEGREGRSRVTGAGLGLMPGTGQARGPYATWPRRRAPTRRPSTRPPRERAGSLAGAPAPRRPAGPHGSGGRRGGPAGGQLAGRSWGPGRGRRGDGGGGGKSRRARGVGGEEALDGPSTGGELASWSAARAGCPGAPVGSRDSVRAGLFFWQNLPLLFWQGRGVSATASVVTGHAGEGRRGQGAIFRGAGVNDPHRQEYIYRPPKAKVHQIYIS